MKDNIKKYTLDYSYLRDMRRFESKMNNGQFDSMGHYMRKRGHDANTNGSFLSDIFALLKSVNS